MSSNTRNYTKALYGFDAVVRRVSPGQWDAQSPCTGWTARDVLAHASGVVDAVAQMARTGEVAMPQMPDLGNDPVGLWSESDTHGRTRLSVSKHMASRGRVRRRRQASMCEPLMCLMCEHLQMIMWEHFEIMSRRLCCVAASHVLGQGREDGDGGICRQVA